MIGVAQVMNKSEGSGAFSKEDEEIFANYLTFCGIGLTNARLYERSLREYNRNQVWYGVGGRGTGGRGGRGVVWVCL